MTTSKLVTGRLYERGIPRIVTGWLVQCPNLNGKAADTLVPVTLLTEDGERLRNVLTRVIDVLGVEVRHFDRFTDHMLLRVVETNMGGLDERAFAELLYRERQDLKVKAREESARLEASQRAAAMLKAGV